ncbi:unnamed protein product [Lathyrus oleraceus]
MVSHPVSQFLQVAPFTTNELNGFESGLEGFEGFYWSFCPVCSSTVFGFFAVAPSLQLVMMCTIMSGDVSLDG